MKIIYSNILSFFGVVMFADIHKILAFAVLITALILNVKNIYDKFKPALKSFWSNVRDIRDN